MAKFYRPKLNSWLTTLVLASIGLHGLVLALPLPRLVEPPPEEVEELPDPEVIQVVTLPKLATAPESPDPPIPDPPLEEEPQPVVEAVEEIVITEPELLDEIEPEFIEPDDIEFNDDLDTSNESGEPVSTEDGENGQQSEPTLEQRIASLDSYSNFDGSRVGDGAATSQLGEIVTQTGIFPSPLRELESVLSAIVVPLNSALLNLSSREMASKPG
ncbi:MAG: hypothetical protein F6K11_37825 [Leptolyngbya sp. SIO3F4]|nr:hypothetical protein [Leptolyngbya sp. SIO3F4]